ncbi:MAG: 1-acyl-sn-glycerol-3-phosphate acyltransferase [Bacteroidales bacterium]|nr:1-acyl-sn-glycerol-3-phosphate acyltransferase [Bacteroidales bacterium]
MGNINITRIIKDSDSKFLKSLPDFAIRIIAKIIKQDDFNRIINKYSDYEGIDFINKFTKEIDIKIEIDGIENLPENGKCFFVANHPFGFLDGLIFTNIVGNKYGQIKAIGNDAFMFIPNIRPIIVNVSVFGKNPKKYFIELNKVFASEIPITHFPFGLVSRIHKFKIQDKFWKKSFITKAISNQRNVVPIKFYGRNSNLFYIIYIIRQIFKIKLNIELVLLPREMFRKRGKTIKVSIGKPIHYKEFNNTLSHYDWAQKVRSVVYDL